MKNIARMPSACSSLASSVPLAILCFRHFQRVLPAALALAEELEGNRERYQFAAGYDKYIEKDEDKGNKFVSQKPKQEVKNPHFEIKNSLPTKPKSEERIDPMDVDPSSTKFRQNNFFRNSERRPRPVGLRHNNMNRRKLQTEELEPERKEIYWSVNVPQFL